MSTAFLLALGGLLLLGSLYRLHRKITFSGRCPVCANQYADRSLRRKIVKFYLGFLPLKAYRCNNCNHYFYWISL